MTAAPSPSREQASATMYVAPCSSQLRSAAYSRRAASLAGIAQREYGIGAVLLRVLGERQHRGALSRCAASARAALIQAATAGGGSTTHSDPAGA